MFSGELKEDPMDNRAILEEILHLKQVLASLIKEFEEYKRSVNTLLQVGIATADRFKEIETKIEKLEGDDLK